MFYKEQADRETERDRKKESQSIHKYPTIYQSITEYDTVKIIVTVQFHEGSKIFHFFSEKQ